MYVSDHLNTLVIVSRCFGVSMRNKFTFIMQDTRYYLMSVKTLIEWAYIILVDTLFWTFVLLGIHVYGSCPLPIALWGDSVYGQKMVISLLNSFEHVLPISNYVLQMELDKSADAFLCYLFLCFLFSNFLNICYAGFADLDFNNWSWLIMLFLRNRSNCVFRSKFKCCGSWRQIWIVCNWCLRSWPGIVVLFLPSILFDTFKESLMWTLMKKTE